MNLKWTSGRIFCKYSQFRSVFFPFRAFVLRELWQRTVIFTSVLWVSNGLSLTADKTGYGTSATCQFAGHDLPASNIG